MTQRRGIGGNHATLVGDRELREAVTLLNKSLLDDLQPIHLEAAGIVAPVASALAPRLTGALAGSISATATRTSGRVISGEPYAGAIHWGWPERNIEANTFAVTAARATEDSWVGVYTDGVQDLIDQAIEDSGASAPAIT